MSRVAFGRREAYDNIALGGGAAVITSQERVLPDASGAAAGTTPPEKDRVTFAHSENLIAIGSASLIENQGIAVDGPDGERPGGL